MSWPEVSRRWLQGHIDLLTYYHSQKPTTSRLLFISICIIFTLIPIVILWQSMHRGGLPYLNRYDPSVEASRNHPVETLTTAAHSYFDRLSQRQSRSFEEVVAEYKRRYKRNPPPHFDKWYNFVQDNDGQLIDEYNGIDEILQPFWGIAPAVVRHNVKRALNTDEFLMGIHIRGGRINDITRGEEWIQNVTRAAIEPFVHLLPDMDLAFNMHDEPRVIIPYDRLVQLNERARASQNHDSPSRHEWSPPPSDLDAEIPVSSLTTPFLMNFHQFTWELATLSCPPTSPARTIGYDGLYATDNRTAFIHQPLGFVRDHNSFTDICQSPSVREKHGIFNRPNAWSVTYEPIPIFSPSKISSCHDILYPAPWYLGEKTVYDEDLDPLWDKKKDSLYWRGTTSGGYSRGGVWRKWARQRFVAAAEKAEEGWILEHTTTENVWSAKQVPAKDYADMFDVHFSYIEECAEEDCEEQRQYFHIVEPDPQEENWKHKILVDIDGHAFSGRFYSFLQSRSMALKQALFREWHEERIFPWVHYLPLGLNNTDYLEIMRFLTQEEKGQQLAREMAVASREWAFATLRQVDMQAWMFRLLLEYGRLVDDARNELGYGG